MPLQNRVTPFGELVAEPARGTLMGNRGGCLHDEHQRLRRRRWVSERWITCLLEFRGWRREVMRPAYYTELFFLDEATALAAGHRPCAECRRADLNRFRAAWVAGNPEAGVTLSTSISAIDQVLHGERCGPGWTQRTSKAALGALPDGVMVAGGPRACLLHGGKLWEWRFTGYGGNEPADPDRVMTVLTPASTIRAIAAGYTPGFHDSLAPT